jgi:hypothetical protein
MYSKGHGTFGTSTIPRHINYSIQYDHNPTVGAQR